MSLAVSRCGLCILANALHLTDGRWQRRVVLRKEDESVHISYCYGIRPLHAILIIVMVLGGPVSGVESSRSKAL